MFNFSSKIVPVVVESNEIPLDSHVVIRDDDDDMNGSCGTFKGVFKNHQNIYRSLIVLDEGNKNFYAKPETVYLLNS